MRAYAGAAAPTQRQRQGVQPDQHPNVGRESPTAEDSSALEAGLLEEELASSTAVIMAVSASGARMGVAVYDQLANSVRLIASPQTSVPAESRLTWLHQLRMQIGVFQVQEDGKGAFPYQVGSQANFLRTPLLHSTRPASTSPGCICTAQSLQLLKQQARPGIIYACSKADPALLAAIRQPLGQDDDAAHTASGAQQTVIAQPGPFTVRLERAAAFHYDLVR
jgi:hypothetical protein